MIQFNINSLLIGIGLFLSYPGLGNNYTHSSGKELADVVRIMTDTIIPQPIPTYKDRKNEIQDSLMVNTETLTISAWDKGVVDNDIVKITHIYHDGYGFIVNPRKHTIPLKRRKQFYNIELKKGVVNYLRMDVDSMGTEPSFNTATISFSAKGKKSRKLYSLNADKKKSALFKFLYSPEITEPFVEFVQLKGKQLAQIQLDASQDLIKIASPCLMSGVESTLLVEGKKYFIGRLHKGETTIPLHKKLLGHPALTLRLERTKDNGLDSCKVRLTTPVDGQEQVLLESFRLSHRQKYNIPILFEEKHTDVVKQITVSDTILSITLNDPNKEDGEIITVKQNDKTIIFNYTLMNIPKKWEVKITPNATTVFSFIPVYEGKIPDNTTMVNVYAGSKRLTYVELKSQKIGEGAKLVVIHKAQN